MVVEMLFNKKFQVIFFWTEFKLYIYIVVYIIEKKLWISFQIFHLNKLSIKYVLLYLKFCVMFKWNMV
jgi:hypothetical protein